MNFFRKLIRFINPSVEPRVLRDMDRRGLRSIHIISLIIMVFETATLVFFISSHFSGFDHRAVISLISVCFCITLCAAGTILSQRMLRKEDFSHRNFFIFKISFFVLFSVAAIFVDYRHYKVDEQMITFYAVNLIMVCFILFRPWIGAIFIGCAYAGLYVSLYSVDRAAGIEPLNFIMMALASMASNAIMYHAQINISSKTIRLTENNAALENASRMDGLTGLLNRLALEADARETDGRRMTAYMIDINYFKEINDQHGHAAGDAILKDTSETLKRMFPGARYYRYGGDEFLVLTHRAPEENYGSDTYDFVQEQYGVKVYLSIGNAQSNPATYQELFDLISKADKALYVTKQRTHSVEFGGHDRRKRDR